MVTGQLPFTGSTLLELANARLASDAPSPASVRPAVPPRWDSAIRACLANAPAARPSSVADVARALALA
jgi:hypothetical protein